MQRIAPRDRRAAADCLAELKKFRTERERAVKAMENLSSLRSQVVLFGSEAELDAHDSRFAAQQRRADRATAHIERVQAERVQAVRWEVTTGQTRHDQTTSLSAPMQAETF